MHKSVYLKIPLSQKNIESLSVGDKVFLTGTIYGARDLVHKKFMELIKYKNDLPIPLKGQVIYYTAMSPPPPKKIVGAIGPTSSYRMDRYTPILLDMGLKGMIGKGPRSEIVKKAIIKNKAIYMVAIGGAGALISTKIKYAKIIAYKEFAPECLMEFYVENLPLIVANDIYGNDLYVNGRKKYCIK